MEKNCLVYKTCLQLLQQELLPALGCTEPIAIAFCAAKARQVLGAIPHRVVLEVSGNIIKNVKSVVVPHTGGKKGLKAAVAIGILFGDATQGLQVISHVPQDSQAMLDNYLAHTVIDIIPATSGLALDICISVFAGAESAKVRVCNDHTAITLIERNGEKIFAADPTIAECATDSLDYSIINVENILKFAQAADIADIKDILDCQISYNCAIADEGLQNDYGANIGKVILRTNPADVRNRAKARAAAASDARMGGCELPVVINSGSGNQGIAVSIPVIEYHRELNLPPEKLYRALIISNLISLRIKAGIGRLSAYCGAVSAGVGAATAIAYLRDGDYTVLAHTIVNALAIASGIVCDGAKASCAAKIAVSIDAGLMGYEMYQMGQQFYDGEGLILKGVENTINNFCIMAKEGMYETDNKIIELMMGSC